MPDHELIEGQLTESVIGGFYEVYNALGYGFLEQVYMAALERELRTRGHADSNSSPRSRSRPSPKSVAELYFLQQPPKPSHRKRRQAK
jgi:hypothetical protein